MDCRYRPVPGTPVSQRPGVYASRVGARRIAAARAGRRVFLKNSAKSAFLAPARTRDEGSPHLVRGLPWPRREGMVAGSTVCGEDAVRNGQIRDILWKVEVTTQDGLI